MPVDLLIRGGTIYPGDAAPFSGDIAVNGDRIVAVGPGLSVRATRTIEARGMIVAPGFIDPHTHAGEMLAASDARTRLALPFLMQGVTSVVIGNDGGGDPDVGRTLGQMQAIGVNVATHVGFGAVRQRVIGAADRAPTARELVAMRRLVARGMCAGAIGLSTGLFYAPQRFAKTAEVNALAAEAGTRGGIYDSHVRDESSYSIGVEAAIGEALAIGRAARVPVNISHIKALGRDVWGKAPAVIAMIEAARAGGQRVTADQYPYDASGTSLVASLVPGWAQDGGRAALLRRFDDAKLAERLTSEMGANLQRRGGAEKLLITGGVGAGRTLAQVAVGGDPVAAAIAVIRTGDPAVVSFNMDERDIDAFMRQPWVMTGSDASAGHPRFYGSFARKYAVYAKERRVIGVRAFIERSTALTADTLGFADRGRIAPGKIADIVVFDPQHYAARAFYASPELLATGVRTVVVNGELAVDDGQPTGIAAGRAVRHVPPAGRCP
ncbi:N-acyl-D-amino-acid deacylase family protein [Sphingomonas radiodurans]|uniref:N-acyl-D-amino-acid deacylase family protein n=1 Tax=Sphingomonas radiodurans TaxID=2890321 RepID=UPI001E634DDC|nr:amidohydrolase family protein [Sphingomonas radiodurans]WBH17402.1 amidohydrolase family protein [Sphingomonas radiodurans]